MEDEGAHGTHVTEEDSFFKEGYARWLIAFAKRNQKLRKSVGGELTYLFEPPIRFTFRRCSVQSLSRANAPKVNGVFEVARRCRKKMWLATMKRQGEVMVTDFDAEVVI